MHDTNDTLPPRRVIDDLTDDERATLIDLATSTGDNRPSAYLEGNVVVIRASGLGSCPRALALQLDGVTGREWSDEDLIRFGQGHLYEWPIIEQFLHRNPNLEVLSQQRKVELLCGQSAHGMPVIVRGSTDGTVLDRSTGKVWSLEVKATSDDGVAKWRRGGLADGDGLIAGYRWQTSAYVHAQPDVVGNIMLIGNREREGVLQHVEQFEASQAPYTYAQIVARAHAVVDGWKQPDMPVCDVDSQAKWFCRFWFAHDDDDSRPDIPTFDDAEFLQLVDRHAALAGVEAEAKQQRNEIRARLQALLEARGVDQACDPDSRFTVRLVTQTRNTIDKKRLVEAGIDVDQFTKTSQTRFLRVDDNTTKKA